MLEHLTSMPKVLGSIPITKKKQLSLSGMMLHACNLSNGEKEVDRSRVQGQPGFHETVSKQTNKKQNIKKVIKNVILWQGGTLSLGIKYQGLRRWLGR